MIYGKINNAHGVGVISRFSVGGVGLKRLEETLKEWLAAPAR